MLSQYGFPKELDNKVDLALPPAVKSHSVKVNPSNVQEVVIPAQAGVNTTNAVANLIGTSQSIVFDVPVGIAGQFIDHRFTTLDFTVKYEVVTAGTTCPTTGYLRAGGHAWFDRSQIVSQSGLVLEDIQLYGLVQEQVNQLSLNNADRDSLAMMYGFKSEMTDADNSVQGHLIPALTSAAAAAVGSNTFSYSIPLLSSLIGNQAKTFFDCRTNKLQLTMQTAAICPITLRTGNVSGTPVAPTVKFTISNISLNMQYIDLGAEGLKMLGKVGGLQYSTGKTWRVSTSTLPAASSNYNSILTGLRGSSVNAIITRVSEASIDLSGCANGMYDSKAPSATSINYSVNGVAVPANPVNLAISPATAFSRLQHCTPSFYNMEFKSSAIPDLYCVRTAGATFPSGADQRYNVGSSSAEDSLACFAYGESLERIASGGLLSGENLNSANTYLNIVLNSSSTYNLNFYFIAKMDAIYILDPATGELTVRL